MGLREDVKKGRISLDYAIRMVSLDPDYHEVIRKWLVARKKRNWAFTPVKKEEPSNGES